MRYILKISVLAFALWSATATASTTSTHFGFGIETHPLYDLKGVGGSLLFLDWSVPVNDKIQMSLRTMANGAEFQGTELFRLSSGPAMLFEFQENSYIGYGVAFFRESARVSNQSRSSGDGVSQTISLQRQMNFSEKVRFGWGTYVSLAQGSIDSQEIFAPTASLRLSQGRRFTSRNSGIFASLIVDL